MPVLRVVWMIWPRIEGDVLRRAHMMCLWSLRNILTTFDASKKQDPISSFLWLSRSLNDVDPAYTADKSASLACTKKVPSLQKT